MSETPADAAVYGTCEQCGGARAVRIRWKGGVQYRELYCPTCLVPQDLLLQRRFREHDD